MPGDFIDNYLCWTECIPSPPIFRLWAGITAVAGALERRVWAKVYPNPTYPSLYTVLVATPGVGKGVIEETAHLWRNVRRVGDRKPALHLAPDSTTSASMLMALKEAHRTIIKDGQLVAEYSTLLVAAEEMSVFLPAHDTEFLGRLNSIFNNPPSLRALRVYLKDVVEIIHPNMTILAGAQPGYLASMLPEEAWSMGFVGRLIMIYAGQGPRITLFAKDPARITLEGELLSHLSRATELHGQMGWEPAADQLLSKWYEMGEPPRPEHSRLVYYNNRRLQYVIKLSTISAIARGNELLIRHDDVVRALDWLILAEKAMPDIFREMVHRSDSQVLQELHQFVLKEWVRTKKPLHEMRLINFLSNRIPHEKIIRLLEIAVRGGVVNFDVVEKTYMPRPRSDFTSS